MPGVESEQIYLRSYNQLPPENNPDRTLKIEIQPKIIDSRFSFGAFPEPHIITKSVRETPRNPDPSEYEELKYKISTLISSTKSFNRNIIQPAIRKAQVIETPLKNVQFTVEPDESYVIQDGDRVQNGDLKRSRVFEDTHKGRTPKNTRTIIKKSLSGLKFNPSTNKICTPRSLSPCKKLPYHRLKSKQSLKLPQACSSRAQIPVVPFLIASNLPSAESCVVPDSLALAHRSNSTPQMEPFWGTSIASRRNVEDFFKKNEKIFEKLKNYLDKEEKNANKSGPANRRPHKRKARDKNLPKDYPYLTHNTQTPYSGHHFSVEEIRWLAKKREEKGRLTERSAKKEKSAAKVKNEKTEKKENITETEALAFTIPIEGFDSSQKSYKNLSKRGTSMKKKRTKSNAIDADKKKMKKRAQSSTINVEKTRIELKKKIAAERLKRIKEYDRSLRGK